MSVCVPNNTHLPGSDMIYAANIFDMIYRQVTL